MSAAHVAPAVFLKCFFQYSQAWLLSLAVDKFEGVCRYSSVDKARRRVLLQLPR